MTRRGALTSLVVLALALTAVLGIGFYTAMDEASASHLGGPGGAFTLTDDLGHRVSRASLMGKPSVIYFGYTFCPEVCPTTLLDLSRWIAKLGPAADKLNYVFVTVDPERDTVPVMHEYVSSFDKRIRGFTGTPKQIAQIAREYGVYYAREKGGGANYAVDHSTRVYLMDAKNRYEDSIAYQEKDASALAKLKRLAAP